MAAELHLITIKTHLKTVNHQVLENPVDRKSLSAQDLKALGKLTCRTSQSELEIRSRNLKKKDSSTEKLEWNLLG